MDVWGDEEPGQLAKIKRDHTNAGYLDGITRSKEQSLQGGFDEGYPEGAAMGLEVGRIIGYFQGQGLRDIEKKAFDELSEASLFNSQYYNADATPNFQGTHPLIKKWQDRVQSFNV
ncbi:Uncharacterized protein YAE1 [Wickerhamiella sorbophila]|uniref:Protein YAE1 n=1 Tax=Wickerhamiella sorbophila TaxID=45607 RepID=A0A2T0FJ86_9ASCO|nr:Uncharacterized protein YAE1 [Wickerhamiella sorbophila]PRT55036.1 Uncharacterized protein YAE1 [Wickerhamiella sorbophila]